MLRYLRSRSQSQELSRSSTREKCPLPAPHLCPRPDHRSPLSPPRRSERGSCRHNCQDEAQAGCLPSHRPQRGPARHSQTSRESDTMLTCSMGSTPSHQNQHIILDELLGQTDDAFVLSSACIVATHNGDSTLDLPVDDVLIQGNETLPISSAKHVAKVFMRETSHHILFETGYACLSPILIVVYCLLDDLLGDFQRTLFLKLNMERTLDLGFGRGGHNMCMVVLGHFHQSLEDALDIRHHQLTGSCQKRQRLMEGITGRPDSAPHPYLICRAANPC